MTDEEWQSIKAKGKPSDADYEKRYQALLNKYGIKAGDGGALVMQSNEDPKEAPKAPAKAEKTAPANPVTDRKNSPSTMTEKAPKIKKRTTSTSENARKPEKSKTTTPIGGKSSTKAHTPKDTPAKSVVSTNKPATVEVSSGVPKARDLGNVKVGSITNLKGYKDAESFQKSLGSRNRTAPASDAAPAAKLKARDLGSVRVGGGLSNLKGIKAADKLGQSLTINKEARPSVSGGLKARDFGSVRVDNDFSNLKGIKDAEAFQKSRESHKPATASTSTTKGKARDFSGVRDGIDFSGLKSHIWPAVSRTNKPVKKKASTTEKLKVSAYKTLKIGDVSRNAVKKATDGTGSVIKKALDRYKKDFIEPARRKKT